METVSLFIVVTLFTILILTPVLLRERPEPPKKTVKDPEAWQLNVNTKWQD